MNDANEKQVQNNAIQADDFDPEDSKVWEQADKELREAATNYNPFSDHPFIKVAGTILTLTGGLLIVITVIAFCKKLL
jgi:hypothetical protein